MDALAHKLAHKLPASLGKNLVTLEVCPIAGWEQGSAPRPLQAFAFEHFASFEAALEALAPANRRARNKSAGQVKSSQVRSSQVEVSESSFRRLSETHAPDVAMRHDLMQCPREVVSQSFLHAVTVMAQPHLSVLPPDSLQRAMRELAAEAGLCGADRELVLPQDGIRAGDAIKTRVFILDGDGATVTMCGAAADRAALLVEAKTTHATLAKPRFSIALLGPDHDRLVGSLEDVHAAIRRLRRGSSSTLTSTSTSCP